MCYFLVATSGQVHFSLPMTSASLPKVNAKIIYHRAHAALAARRALAAFWAANRAATLASFSR